MGFLEGEENIDIFLNAHQKVSIAHQKVFIAEKVEKMTYLLNVSQPPFLATPIFAHGTSFKSGHGGNDGTLS